MDRTACDSLGTNVGMTIKGELYFLTLMWVEGTVQWQNIKNLQMNIKQFTWLFPQTGLFKKVALFGNIF